MYQHHFGLRAEPFAVTPDPTFLFTGRGHREALAALAYGVKQRRGFICLVGEIGTGKTTLLRALLEGLDVSVRTVLITHTTIGCDDLHRMILHELSIPYAGLTRAEMVHTLYEFLLAQFEAGHPPPLLIVDEAQNLADAVLEEIRLLTNLEIGESKLLQVILAGQPELERKLRRPGLRSARSEDRGARGWSPWTRTKPPPTCGTACVWPGRATPTCSTAQLYAGCGSGRTACPGWSTSWASRRSSTHSAPTRGA